MLTPNTVVQNTQNLFYIKEIDLENVSKIMSHFSNTKAKDIHNLNHALMKKYSIQLLEPITHLMNL